MKTKQNALIQADAKIYCYLLFQMNAGILGTIFSFMYLFGEIRFTVAGNAKNTCLITQNY